MEISGAKVGASPQLYLLMAYHTWQNALLKNLNHFANRTCHEWAGSLDLYGQLVSEINYRTKNYGLLLGFSQIENSSI